MRHVQRLRETSAQAMVAGTSQTRVKRALGTNTRPAGQSFDYTIGDLVDLHKTSVVKDASGWKRTSQDHRQHQHHSRHTHSAIPARHSNWSPPTGCTQTPSDRTIDNASINLTTYQPKLTTTSSLIWSTLTIANNSSQLSLTGDYGVSYIYDNALKDSSHMLIVFCWSRICQ